MYIRAYLVSVFYTACIGFIFGFSIIFYIFCVKWEIKKKGTNTFVVFVFCEQ